MFLARLEWQIGWLGIIWPSILFADAFIFVFRWSAVYQIHQVMKLLPTTLKPALNRPIAAPPAQQYKSKAVGRVFAA